MLHDSERAWEVPPAWYAKFNGAYPPMGKGFPTTYNPQTPSEILNDNRVLAAPVRMERAGYTVLRQPRIETEAVRMIGMGDAGDTDTLISAVVNILLLAGAVYVVTTTPYLGMRIAAGVVSLGTAINLIRMASNLSKEPVAAYTQERPTYEV